MTPDSPRCIGVLHCGELGGALAGLLRESGRRVVTSGAGRSERTVLRARAAGVELLSTLGEVVDESDVVISLVHPDAALEVARSYASEARAHRRGGLFVDANSIGVSQLAAIEEVITASGAGFVDAAIHGGATRLRDLAVVYLSGRRATELAGLFEPLLRVRVLGERAGQATQLKLLLAGTSKTLNMLFLEMSIVAEKAGVLPTFLEEYGRFYPGLQTAIERMLPTYPEHAARRTRELAAVEKLAEATGARCRITRASAELLTEVAPAWRSRTPGEASSEATTIIEIVRAAARFSASPAEE